LIFKDVNSNKNEDSYIKFVIFGIDKQNALRSLYNKNLDPKLNSFHLIVCAVDGLNCSDGDISYILILTGTIQGFLKENQRTFIG